MTCSGCSGSGQAEYTHIVFVEKPLASGGADGHNDLEDTDNWAQAWRTWARFITPTRTTFSTASGREVQVGVQLQSLAPVVIMVPYSSDSRIPRTSYRIRLGTRLFNIIDARRINEVGEEIQIEAIERKQPA